MRSTRTWNNEGGRILLACGAMAASAVLAACGDHGIAEPSVPVADHSSQPTTSIVNASPIPDPEQVKAARHEGVSLYDRGDYPGAVERLRLVVTGRPGDAYAHYLLGLSLWKSGDLELAEESLVRSSEVSSGSVGTWLNLARVRMERNDAGGALYAADSALAIEPSSPNAMHQRGRALAALGRVEEAIDTLRKAHDANPGNGYVANTLGYLLIQRGRPEEATPLLEMAREMLPDTAYVRNNLGVAYERTGRLEEAALEYRASVDAGGSEGKAALSLARLTPLVEAKALAKPRVPESSGPSVAASVQSEKGSNPDPNPGPR